MMQIMTTKITTIRRFLPVKFFPNGGKIGPSHLLNENDDLSFLLYFSKQCLVEKIHGKFKKNSSVTFISEESP